MVSKTHGLGHFLPPKDVSTVANLKFDCKHCGMSVSSSRQYILLYISLNETITSIFFMPVRHLKIYGVDKFDLELSGIGIDKIELTPCLALITH